MSSDADPSDAPSDELLWDAAFSNVGRAFGEPRSKEEIAKAIEAISGVSPSGGRAAETTHDAPSQLYADPPSAKQQDDPGGRYDFVLYAPPSNHHDTADRGAINIGTGGMAADGERVRGAPEKGGGDAKPENSKEGVPTELDSTGSIIDKTKREENKNTSAIITHITSWRCNDFLSRGNGNLRGNKTATSHSSDRKKIIQHSVVWFYTKKKKENEHT
ncbi:hypothetical protein F5148DRAFT_1310005 [Russula earlei]|uniref:Uncharacterized protein n=1 Tax=Russula earlei TaxID=71964 RepID=A0ACC0U6I2_9AGAM|nr:hypothetical protein F5148DRAFT_1310005 [Russula earlei]